MKTYAYAVLEDAEGEPAFSAALAERHITPEHIFIASPDTCRSIYQSMLQGFDPGDLLCLRSLADLGNNQQQIYKQWVILTEVLEAEVLALDLPMADTRKGPEIKALVTQMLNFSYKYTRNKNRARAKTGLENALAKGVVYGRSRLPEPANLKQVVMRWRARQINAAQAARICGVSESTFRRRAKDLEQSMQSVD